MNKLIVLVACGGHGRVVLDTALSIGYSISGIVDNLPVGTNIFGVSVIGQDKFLDEIDPSNYQILNGFGFIKSTTLRKDKYLGWIDKGFQVIGLIHPSVIFGRECSIDPSAQVLAGVVLQNRVSLGANTVINTRASIDHDVSIGKHCFISPGTIICGGAKIGDEVFIGSGSIILPNIKIESHARISAGSVIKSDIISD